MDVSLMLPDIPQGIVTFASAVLAALALVILTLSSCGFRLLHSIQGRLSELKTGLELLQKQDISSRVAALLERREQK